MTENATERVRFTEMRARAFGTTSGGNGPRPARTSNGGRKPPKSEVVITEIDSVTFDHSEALLHAREALAATKQCSNYIVKTYPTPLRTLTALWDREGNEKDDAVITLTITDSATKKSANARFTLQDIRSPEQVYERFQRLLAKISHPG